MPIFSLCFNQPWGDMWYHHSKKWIFCFAINKVLWYLSMPDPDLAFWHSRDSCEVNDNVKGFKKEHNTSTSLCFGIWSKYCIRCLSAVSNWRITHNSVLHPFLFLKTRHFAYSNCRIENTLVGGLPITQSFPNVPEKWTKALKNTLDDLKHAQHWGLRNIWYIV